MGRSPECGSGNLNAEIRTDDRSRRAASRDLLDREQLRCIVAIMTQVVLVTDTWWKVVDVESADEVLDVEGMSWERDGTHPGNLAAGDRPSEIPPQVPRYVPSIGA